MEGPGIQHKLILQTAPQVPLLITNKAYSNVTFIDGIPSFLKESLSWPKDKV